MRQRCLDPKNKRYHRYGGRGIKICEQWHKFENFLADMGNKPAGMTLDRIDNDGNYEPRNCRWATMKEQGNNTSRCLKLTAHGKTMNRKQWAKYLGIQESTISRRFQRGMTVEQALAFRDYRKP